MGVALGYAFIELDYAGNGTRTLTVDDIFLNGDSFDEENSLLTISYNSNQLKKDLPHLMIRL